MNLAVWFHFPLNIIFWKDWLETLLYVLSTQCVSWFSCSTPVVMSTPTNFTACLLISASVQISILVLVISFLMPMYLLELVLAFLFYRWVRWVASYQKYQIFLSTWSIAWFLWVDHLKLFWKVEGVRQCWRLKVDSLC